MTTINKLQAMCVQIFEGCKFYESKIFSQVKMCIVKFTTLKYVYSVCGVMRLKNLAQSPDTS